MTHYDIEALKANTDCRTLIQSDLGPAHFAGNYYNWRCPLHNEQHGYSLVAYANGWQCFGACACNGDAISWMQKYHNLSFEEACKQLGAPELIERRAKPEHKPRPIELAEPPSVAWQAVAFQAVERAQKVLWSDEGAEALNYLHNERGLLYATIKEARLGYIPGEIGGHFVWHGLKLWTGITIPWFVDGNLWGVKVRRGKGADPKYLPFKTVDSAFDRLGSSQHTKAMYGADNLLPGWPALIVEGEFDCLTIWQEAADLVCPVTVGPAGYAINARWLPELAKAPVILACYDNDEAGNKASVSLGSLTHRARIIHPPAGKDINEYHLTDPMVAITNWIRHEVEALQVTA